MANRFSGKKKKPKLGETEREIMNVLWEREGPLTSKLIQDGIISQSLTLSTVMALLAGLCEKGFVCCDRSTRTNYYTAVISREEYQEEESREFLEKIHGNSFASLISALNNSGSISDDDMTRLRQFLDENLTD